MLATSGLPGGGDRGLLDGKITNPVIAVALLGFALLGFALLGFALLGFALLGFALRRERRRAEWMGS